MLRTLSSISSCPHILFLNSQVGTMATIPLHHHLESIPDQVGIAILRSEDGSIKEGPTGTLSDHDVHILYKMLLEIGGILVTRSAPINNTSIRGKGGECLKRFTVERKGGRDEGEKISYSVCVTGDGFVCIVKRRVSNH